MKPIRVIILASLMIFVLLIGGCSGTKIPFLDIPPDQPEKPSTSLNVDIYWDATLSMRGYAVPVGYTPYRQLPETLENIMGTVWAGSKVNFNSFGKEVVKLEGRGHLNIKQPEFYTETITAINNVIEVTVPGNLSIIVSDLFESDADWSNIAAKLRDKYLAKNMSVAVIGLKNPFEGYVYDVGAASGQSQDAFFYSSGMDKSRYRPFYMIIMGRHADVEVCLEKLRQVSNLGQMEVAFFSSRIAKVLPTLGDAKITVAENLSERNRLQSKGTIPKQAKEFTLGSRNKPAKMMADLNYQATIGAIPFDVNNLAYEVVVKQVRGGNWSEVQEAVKFVEVQTQISVNSINAMVNFSPNKFIVKDNCTAIDVVVRPKTEAFYLPDWAVEWNLDSSQWAGGKLTPENFDGAKTLNLVQLLSGLKNAVVEIQKPQIGRITFVIQD